MLIVESIRQHDLVEVDEETAPSVAVEINSSEDEATISFSDFPDFDYDDIICPSKGKLMV